MKSISNQIIGYILISLCVVFTGFYFYRIQTRTQFETERLEQTSIRACERLAYFVASPILKDDKSLIKKNLGFEVLDENIGSIQILDQNNQLLAGVLSTNDKVSVIKGNQLLILHKDSIVRPVLYQGKTIGKVVLYPNKEPLQKMIGRFGS